MDIIGMLSSPLGLTLLGTAGAVAAPVIAAKLTAGGSDRSITITGSTTGDITQDNRINVTVTNEDNRVVRQTTAPAPSEQPVSDWPEILLFGFVGSVVLALVLWLLAESWSVVSLVLTLMLVATGVLTAIGWSRYPYSTGRPTYLLQALAPVVVAIWAVAALSVPVEGVPTLAAIREAARGLAWSEGIGVVWQVNGPMGLTSYLMRVGGLFLALMMVALPVKTTLGFLAIARGVRSSDEARVARGIMWAGVHPPKSWEGLVTLSLLVLVGFLIHPGSIELVRRYTQG